jgi:hypothetical protein
MLVILVAAEEISKEEDDMRLIPSSTIVEGVLMRLWLCG